MLESGSIGFGIPDPEAEADGLHLCALGEDERQEPALKPDQIFASITKYNAYAPVVMTY